MGSVDILIVFFTVLSLGAYARVIGPERDPLPGVGGARWISDVGGTPCTRILFGFGHNDTWSVDASEGCDNWTLSWVYPNGSIYINLTAPDPYRYPTAVCVLDWDYLDVYVVPEEPTNMQNGYKRSPPSHRRENTSRGSTCAPIQMITTRLYVLAEEEVPYSAKLTWALSPEDDMG